MASPLVTARDMVTGSLLLLGVIAQGEVPTASELRDGFLRLNEMIDGWALQPLTMLVNERHVYPLVADQQTYDLGPTPAAGGFSIASRPQLLTNASRLMNASTPANEQFIDILSDDEYAAIAMKTMTSTDVTAIYYRPTSPNGSVFLWPNPSDATNDLVLYFDSIFSQFADPSTGYTLPAGYAKAVRYNLALDLAPEFGRTIDPLVELTARTSLRQVKAANVRMSELSIDPALTGHGGSYDIYTDGY